jgi:hypothetical protein
MVATDVGAAFRHREELRRYANDSSVVARRCHGVSAIKIGERSKNLLLGYLIGVAGGLAGVPWIGVYGTLTDTGIAEVARDINALANTLLPGAVANTFAPRAPFETESVGSGIAIYMLAAIGLGIPLAFVWRTLSPHQPSPMDGLVFVIATLSTVAVVGAVVGAFIGIASR